MANKTQTKTTTKTEILLPRLYKVILLNDDVTTMQFVVAILMQIFGKNITQAVDIMLNVHETGRGVCGVYAKEIAISKQNEVMKAAKAENFPLQCIIEED